MRKISAEILLKARADPDAANFGKRPLHFAAKNGHPEIAKSTVQKQTLKVAKDKRRWSYAKKLLLRRLRAVTLIDSKSF
jgi:ankyrin repeat protein